MTPGDYQLFWKLFKEKHKYFQIIYQKYIFFNLFHYLFQVLNFIANFFKLSLLT